MQCILFVVNLHLTCLYLMHVHTNYIFFAAGTLEVHDMEGGEMQVTVDLSEGTTGGGAAAQDSVAAVSPEDDDTIEREATDVTGLTLPTPPKNFGTIFLAHL